MDKDVVSEFMKLLTAPYLLAALIAYLVGQISKIFLLPTKHQKFNFREFFASGNMPSTHTASTCALTTAVGLTDGFGSSIFAVSAMLTLVVAYDAMHVRRAVGEQGLVLRQLIDRDHHQESEIAKLAESSIQHKLIKPYFSRGHKPTEVLVGGILGVLVGIAVCWLLG